MRFNSIPALTFDIFRVWIDSVKWGTTGIPQVTPGHGSAGPAALGQSIYVQPDRPIFLNYALTTSFFTPTTEGLLIARVGDGLIAPAHQNIPPAIGLVFQRDGVFQLSGWPNPFPASLYGYHQVILDLWAVTPNGQPLPPEYQTNPPDPRKFVLQSSDWAWLWVSPGCRENGGIDFCTIKSFSVTPTQVTLDPTGKYVLPNQSLTLKWEVDTLDLPATQFGFKGSFTGIELFFLPYGNPIVNKHGPKIGSLNLQLGGPDPNNVSEYFYPAIGISTSPGTTCGPSQRSIALSGVIPNTPPLTPKPADIIPVGASYNPSNPRDIIIRGGTPFVVYFQCANQGGQATGPFTARMVLDNNIQVKEVNIASMIPGAIEEISWDFSSGLASGDHWIYCSFDSDNVVKEPIDHNLTSLNIDIW